MGIFLIKPFVATTQRVGVAMGEKFAPNIANLFMALWEDRHIFNTHRSILLFYHRYIDDLILIWVSPKHTVEEFLSYLNQDNNNIKCYFQVSDTSIHFLDVTIERS